MSQRYELVDLMLDASEWTQGKPAEMVVHIVKTRGGYLVVQAGRMSDGLAFDEMLGQVVNLLHPKLGEPHYPMMTREQIAAREQWRAQSLAERENTE